MGAQVWKRSLSGLVGLVLALLSVEAVARHYAYSPTAASVKRWNREGNAVSHWRDGIRLPVATDAQERVLVVGDSFTAGVHVADDQTFSAVTERLLRERGRRVSVLNAGRPGANLADHAYSGPTLAEREHASWTLVVINDEDLGSSSWAKSATHFLWRDGKLAVSAPPEARGARRQALATLRTGSALFQNARLQANGLRQMANDWHPFRAVPSRSAPRPERSYPIAEELDFTRSAFQGRVSFIHLGLEPATTPTEARFLAACARLQLRCLTTRQELNAVRSRGAPPRGFPNSGWDVGHLNPLGHEAVAQALVAAKMHGFF
jgi:hypothetical protein